MASTTIRNTYAFDAATVATIKALAQRWGVSQSEAIRRAVRMSALQAKTPFENMTPVEALEYAIAHPLYSKEEGERRLRELKELRKGFDREDEP